MKNKSFSKIRRLILKIRRLILKIWKIKSESFFRSNFCRYVIKAVVYEIGILTEVDDNANTTDDEDYS